jgi:ankyrin repeat protein
MIETLNESRNLIKNDQCETLIEMLEVIDKEFGVNELIDEDGITLLHMAASLDKADIVEALINHAK